MRRSTATWHGGRAQDGRPIEGMRFLRGQGAVDGADACVLEVAFPAAKPNLRRSSRKIQARSITPCMSVRLTSLPRKVVTTRMEKTSISR